jgi:hypothetical protein
MSDILFDGVYRIMTGGTRYNDCAKRRVVQYATVSCILAERVIYHLTSEGWSYFIAIVLVNHQEPDRGDFGPCS